VLLVASCHHGPEPFATRGAYVAPKSGVRVLLYAKGTVPPHQDLANDAATIAVVCPTTKVGRPFRFEVAPGRASPRNVVVTTSATITEPWSATSREAALSRAFADAGYAPPDAAELAEIADAVDGIALGPKATRIAGQTMALTVESVEFEATAPPTLASCSP